MRISCFSDEIAPALKDQVRVMTQLGIKNFEVRTVDDISVMDLSEEALKAVRKTADTNNMAITCVSSPIGKENLLEADINKNIEYVKTASNAAHIFGCNFIRIFSFFQQDAETQKALDMTSELLYKMSEQAKAEETVLIMEGGGGTVGRTAKNALTLFENVNSKNLRCAFDAAALLAAGDNPPDSFEILKDYVEYFHIKDAKRGESQRVVAGEGDTNIEQILNKVRDKDYILSLEPHLAYAGAKRGFSGEEPFCRAYHALANMLIKLKIEF